MGKVLKLKEIKLTFKEKLKQKLFMYFIYWLHIGFILRGALHKFKYKLKGNKEKGTF